MVVDVKGLNLNPAAWGDPNALEPGDWVLALGQAGGVRPRLRLRRRLGFRPGQAEIEDFHPHPLAFQPDVARLDVAVDQAAAVRVVEATRGVEADEQRL